MGNNNPKDKYLTDWKGVWKIYRKKNLKKSLVLPLILSGVSLFICCFLSNKDSLYFIEKICNLIVSIVPAILGFTLSGYALMMGLSSSNFIEALMNTSISVGKKSSLQVSMFQILNTTFAVVLGSAFVTTLTGVVGNLIVSSEIILINLPLIWLEIMNWSVFFIISFLLYYTINSIKDIVINIFNFGQFIQVYNDTSIND